VEDIRAAEETLRKDIRENQGGFCARVRAGKNLDESDREAVVCVARETAVCFLKEPDRANP
jgi:hypothetical protein